MKNLKCESIIIFILCVWNSIGIYSQNAMGVESIFAPSYDKWKLTDKIQVFDSDNLYNYIDGAADNYLSFNFKELLVRTYEIDSENYITVEIYNHLELSQAFGIYASERPLNATIEKIGVQGYQDDGILNFFIGKYYVKLSTHNKNPETKLILKTIATDLSPQLDNQNSLPEILEFFPILNKIPNSESYTNNNFLGHEFLKSAFTANYISGNKVFKVFIMFLQSKEEAQSILSKYAAYAKTSFNSEPGRYVLNDPHNGVINLEWKERYIWGVYGDSKDKLKQEYLQMVKNLLFKQ